MSWKQTFTPCKPTGFETKTYHNFHPVTQTEHSQYNYHRLRLILGHEPHLRADTLTPLTINILRNFYQLTNYEHNMCDNEKYVNLIDKTNKVDESFMYPIRKAQLEQWKKLLPQWRHINKELQTWLDENQLTTKRLELLDEQLQSYAQNLIL